MKFVNFGWTKYEITDGLATDFSPHLESKLDIIFVTHFVRN